MQAFARDLEEKLYAKNTSHPLKAHLHKEIEILSLLHNITDSGRRVELDKHGTRLWNLASKLTQEKSWDTELLCSGKTTESPRSELY